jgi:hypothetical protein
LHSTRSILFLLVVLCLTTFSLTQTETATISGRVTDQQGGLVQGAEVIVTSVDTNLTSRKATNSDGRYALSGLKPGRYRITVTKGGFSVINLTDVVLHVQDSISQNFSLKVGSVSESITVTADQTYLNTTDGSVSTVVDHNFVANLPLNGRSFQDLILLTPGIVTNNPQSPSTVGSSGEFSVNGQRTESNYYSVDGVSANIGAISGVPSASAAGISGSLPAATAVGTTQSLVPVDALEEFRVQSSTYSAEYGRNPGGQFSFATRSGASQWHGTAFNYIRNNYFDANDWFNDYFGQPEPGLRQNDFGGTLGGPIPIQGTGGKNKTFFFFSYEGLRLTQPQPATLNYVPNRYLRTCTSGLLQQAIKAFPLPSASSPTPDCTQADPGNGLASFISSWSNSGKIESVSVRLDHAFGEKVKVFFRFSNSPSTQTVRLTGNYVSPAINSPSTYTARTYTLGANGPLSNRLVNDFRLNYSSNDTKSSGEVGALGGGQATNLVQLSGLNSNAYVAVGFLFPTWSPSLYQYQYSGVQRQWNVVDTLILSLARHQFKFGLDYRRLTPSGTTGSPLTQYYYFSEGSVVANAADQVFVQAQLAAYPLYSNFSAFAQDEWRPTQRLSLSTGLRWEVNPAPGVTKGILPYTANGSSLSTLGLAPQGTPLWNTTWYNFAPRLGVAYVARQTPSWETVIRGGGGVFFDSGQQPGSAGFQGPGYSQAQVLSSAAFPLPPAQANISVANPPVPPYGTALYAFPRHLQLPYTLEWSASVEQALNKSQALTLTYVGAHASRLLEANSSGTAVNPNFPQGIVVYQNGLTSDYGSLQVQFQRRLNQGLQVLASYTYAHAIDYGSNNTSLPYVRGNSDFDIRHSFTSALSYELPDRVENRVLGALLHHWGLDDRFTIRTGFPVTLRGATQIDPATGKQFNAGLDLVVGQPLYVYGTQYPGKRSVNPAAFQTPTGQFGDAPRNLVRGFGAWQMDVAVRRDFPLHERLKLQFRAEAFNVFNHPSFGTINPYFGQSNFGQATATLAQSLGVLSPLYQMGGPRSMQFALKLMF